MLRHSAAANLSGRPCFREESRLVGAFVLAMIAVAYLLRQVAHRTGGKDLAKTIMRKLCSLSSPLISSGVARVGFTSLGTLNDIDHRYGKYLRQHGGARPRTAGSRHYAIKPGHVEEWRERWDMLGIFDL